MKVLVVYDITGTVWNVIYGSELEPGALAVAAMEIPEGSRITGVNLSDPKNPNPVYETASPSETDRILEMMTELKDEVKASREDTKVLTMLWSSIFVTLVAKKYHESVTLPSGLRMVYDNH